MLSRNSKVSEYLYWDTSDEPGLQGGHGTWSTETHNWNVSADGAGARMAWREGAVAIFKESTKCRVFAEGSPKVAGIDAAFLDVVGGSLSIPSSGIEILTAGEVVLSSAVQGSGPLLKRGKGMLSLVGINSLPSGITLFAGKLRIFSSASLGQGELRVEGHATLIPGSANTKLEHPVTIAPGVKLTLETNAPEFAISGPIAGGGELEKTGRGALTISGTLSPQVRLIGTLGDLRFAPSQAVKLNALIQGGLLRVAPDSLLEGSSLLITQAGALAASGAHHSVQTWVDSGWISPDSNGTLAWDSQEDLVGTIDLKSFGAKYPSMSVGACRKMVVSGRLEVSGAVLRIGGGGGEIDLRSAMSGNYQLLIGAPSTSGVVTLSAPNSFTGGLRIDGGTLRMGNAQAIPEGIITMGNRFTNEENCQLDLNNYSLVNPIKLEGRVTLKNSGGRASTLMGGIEAGPHRFCFAAGKGSSIKVTGVVESSSMLIIRAENGAPAGKANLVELAPLKPNLAQRVQVEGGSVLRALEGLGLPTRARLVLMGGVFESHGEFNRPLLIHKGARDGEGGVTVIWDPYSGSGFSAQGGPFVVRFAGGAPWVWGTQTDGSVKPGNDHLVLNAPSADSLLMFDVPLDLAGEALDRKNNPTPLHRLSVHASEAMLPQAISNSGAKPAGILKLGAGTLALKGANSYNGNTVVREGTLAFHSPTAIAGSGRTISPGNGSVVAANFPIDNAFLQRLESPSAMAFTVALGADSSAPLDLNSSTGAILRAASIGATKEALYSGKITPCGGSLRLGGGGGTLVIKNLENAPSIVGGVLTPSRVVLPAEARLPENFVLLDGALVLGAQAYLAPKSSARPVPAPLPAEAPILTASSTDRWVDAQWTYPVDPAGGFVVEYSLDGQTFKAAGSAWPEERRFPLFLKDPQQNGLGVVHLRVAAIDDKANQGAWSSVAKTERAQRFDPAEEIPAMFAGSADQRKYSANDPERLVHYSEQDKDAQRSRGRDLATKLKSLSKTTDQEWIIPSGIYRIKVGQLAVEGANNLTLRAPGVELIVDDEKSGGAFSFTKCEDLVLTGSAINRLATSEPGDQPSSLNSIGPMREEPYLALDSEQLTLSMVRITGINTADLTLDVEVLPGYDMNLPQKERLLAYRPDGSLANIAQMGWDNYQVLGGRSLRLNVSSLRNPLIQNAALTPGNLLALHIAEEHRGRTHGLASLQYCRNVTYESIRFFNGGGSPADHRTTGHTIYRNWRNTPRPGTSRLAICSGLGQFSKDGGSFLFENCEFGPHLDDGINLLSIIGMTLRQSGANTLVIAGAEPKPGETLTFYDFYSWKKLGKTKIVYSKLLKEPESDKCAIEWCDRNRITSHALRGVWSVTLENPVQITPFAPVVYSNYRCDNITVRGCLFRDQVAQIMLLQGAKSGLIENNLLLRSTGPAISMQFAQYWWEGPQPSNFIVRNNVIRDNPVGAPVSGWGGLGSICVWAGTVRSGDSGRNPYSASDPLTERLFSGFRIEGNTIINSGGYGILLRNTQNAVIRYNRIVNPGLVHSEVPLAGIGLDQVSNAVVSDNEVVLGKGNASKAVDLMDGCDLKTIWNENNR